MLQMTASNQDLSKWNGFQWRRKTESFGDRDEAVVAVGATGNIEGIWQVFCYSPKEMEVLLTKKANPAN